MKKKAILRFIIEAFTVIALVYVFAYPYMVEGESMLPGYSTGDRVFINRLSPKLMTLDYGDIVVCTMDKEAVIKRVIAMSGDRLLIEEGVVYLNGSPLTEGYLYEDEYTGGSVDITLGSDEYFLMGDNRSISKDSRQLGAVNVKDIIGKVVFKLP